MRPSACFFENVEGHISLGLPDVIEDLAGLGYRTTWGIFSAAEVGAPHQRKRVFILAHCDGVRLQQYAAEPNRRHRQNLQEQFEGGRASELAYRCESGLEGMLHHIAAQGRQDEGRSAAGCGEHRGDVWPSRPGELADATGAGHTTHAGSLCCGESEAWRQHVPEPQHCGATAWPSRPGEQQYWWEPPRTTLGDANGKRQQKRQGQQRPGLQGADADAAERSQTQPPLGRDADGPASGMDYAELCVSCDNRTDELRLLGNGVVPATAERAFRLLMQELMYRR